MTEREEAQNLQAPDDVPVAQINKKFVFLAGAAAILVAVMGFSVMFIHKLIRLGEF